MSPVIASVTKVPVMLWTGKTEMVTVVTTLDDCIRPYLAADGLVVLKP